MIQGKGMDDFYKHMKNINKKGNKVSDKTITDTEGKIYENDEKSADGICELFANIKKRE